MKQRVERLVQLHQIKQQQTQVVYLEFIQVKDQLNQNKLKQEQLTSYRQEYLRQLESIGHTGAQIGRLRNRLDFINQLDTALIQLGSHLKQLQKLVIKSELIYNQAKAAEEGVEKLIERVKKTAELKIQKNEQKESDEYAQKQWYSKKTNEQTDSFNE